MKIEKVNENQIRCVLNREDLEQRQIKLSELAYGSDKAKKLFHEMVKEANERFDFDVEDIPLMVEAIPVSSESLVLLISKVEYPDELDPRFSRFSDPGEEYFEQESAETEKIPAQKGADDIVELFRKKEKAETPSEEEHAEERKTGSRSEEENDEKADMDLISLFEFCILEQAEELAGVLKDYYHGENSLYKDDRRNRYFLLMHKNDHSPEAFNKICNMASEFGRETEYVPAMSAYFAEHARLIIGQNALQTLASL